MDKSRLFFTRLRFAVLLLVTLSPAMETIAARKTEVQPAPPQPMAQKATVKRGENVEIPLKIYGTRAQKLSWIVRQKPAHGKLSDVRATAAEAAVVTYRPPTDVRVVSDRFTFSVRSSEGVSAPVEVTIAITDDAPEIRAAGELNFGELLTGTTATRTLEFSNDGGGIAEGMFQADAPWKVEGVRRYKLGAGEKHVAKIVFAPERPGKFESEVTFTSQPDRVVVLRGVAEDPLAVAPAELLLAHDAGRPLRAASFELRNNTNTALDVSIAASARLILKTTVHVAAHAAEALTVQTAESDVAPLEETIVITAGALTARLPVKANALPALVRARPGSVIFNSRASGASREERVVFVNEGGLASMVTLAIDPPFAVDDASFLLQPGTEKTVDVSAPPPSSAVVHGALKVGTDGGGFEIPVEAAGVPLSSGLPVPRRVKSPVPAQPRREEERPEPMTVHSGSYSAKVDSVSANSATFRWKGALPQGAELRCLRRILSLDEAGELVSTFVPYSAFKVAQSDGVNVATVEKLEPGGVYLFRIDAVDAGEATTATFAQIHVPDVQSRKGSISLVHVLFALLLITGGISIWHRTRPRSGF